MLYLLRRIFILFYCVISAFFSYFKILCYNENGGFMLYTSIDNKKIKDIKKLNTKKYRDKCGKFLVEGEHLVLEAYKTGYLEELIIEKDVIFPIDVETSYVSNNVINYISELQTPQKIMGICKKIEDNSYGNRILILDDIQDPGNLGTIIRSCVAFNIDTNFSIN